MTAPGISQLALPIVTERLVLRDFVPADAAAMRCYMLDPIHWAYQLVAAPAHTQVDDLIERILQGQNAVARQNYVLGVSLRAAPDTVIGEGVISRSADLGNRQGEIGFGLMPSHWGRGYGTEIARGLIRAGFEELKLHRLTGRCSPENAASVRVMEKTGLVREALLRDLVFGRGRWWSTAIYGLLEEEYAALAPLAQHDLRRAVSA